jgi:hypothetical protein
MNATEDRPTHHPHLPDARRFGREHRAPKHPAFIPQPGLTKQRELRFNQTPAGQAERAEHLLAPLEGLEVLGQSRPLALVIRYEISRYTFRGIELTLEGNGFHLDNSLYMKLLRALVNFCEETQLRNLVQPERLIKKSNEIYVQAWEHHPHGDHDDTPPELREYK